MSLKIIPCNRFRYWSPQPESAFPGFYRSAFPGQKPIITVQSLSVYLGVLNGPILFKSGHKIIPMLELLAKIRWVLACSCSQNFCYRLHARILVNGKTEKQRGNMHSLWMFLETSRLRFADERKNSSRKVKEPPKVEINLDTWKHEEYYCYYNYFTLKAYLIWLRMVRSWKPPKETCVGFVSFNHDSGKSVAWQFIETETGNAW